MLSKQDKEHLRRGAWCNMASQMPDPFRARYIRVNGVVRFSRLSLQEATVRWANLVLVPKAYATLEYCDGKIIEHKTSF